jgi:hypothetical protein
MMCRRMRATWVVASAAIALCAWWAALPLQGPARPEATLVLASPSSAPLAATPKHIDPQAFAVRLWNAPPAASGSQEGQHEATGSPTPVQFALIGIIHEGGQLKAALYHAQTDRVLIVTNGDRIGRHTVTQISASTVEVSDGRLTSRLKLREDRL